jgi:hypothetical protein
MEPRASSASSITSAKRRAEGSVLQRAPMAGTLSSTGANIARRSVLHPGGKLLGRSDIFTCRVADMGEGERVYIPPKIECTPARFVCFQESGVRGSKRSQ